MNGSVGESHVCGRGLFDTFSRAVVVEGLSAVDSGKVVPGQHRELFDGLDRIEAGTSSWWAYSNAARS